MTDTFRCPGCSKNMAGFVHHEAHYADERPHSSQIGSWPWTSLNPGNAIGSVCPWTRDFLSAEWLRRYPQPWSYA